MGAGQDSSAEKRYSGQAWMETENGLKEVDVSECPGKCAIGDECAAEEACTKTYWTGMIICTVIGVLVITIALCLCCKYGHLRPRGESTRDDYTNLNDCNNQRESNRSV